jgi:hypothetical protein
MYVVEMTSKLAMPVGDSDEPTMLVQEYFETYEQAKAFMDTLEMKRGRAISIEHLTLYEWGTERKMGAVLQIRT